MVGSNYEVDLFVCFSWLKDNLNFLVSEMNNTALNRQYPCMQIIHWPTWLLCWPTWGIVMYCCLVVFGQLWCIVGCYGVSDIRNKFSNCQRTNWNGCQQLDYLVSETKEVRLSTIYAYKTGSHDHGLPVLIRPSWLDLDCFLILKLKLWS